MPIDQKKVLMIVIIFFILIIIVGGLIYLAITREWIKKEIPPQIPTIEYYIKAIDGETQEPVDANYLLLTNGTEIRSSVVFSDAYTPLIVQDNLTYELACWSKEYYLGKLEKEFSNIEKNENKSKSDCEMRKIGNLTISHRGGIEAKYNKIDLEIESKDGWYNKMGMCFAWSTGILDVKAEDVDMPCDKGAWKNWTRYIRENKTYEYLPKGWYRCGNDWLEECESIYSNKCKLTQMETPDRFLGIVDYCQYTAKTYSINETDEIKLLVTTIDNMRIIDYLEITFFDTDDRWDGNTWKSYSEFKGIDIAARDKKYTIFYGG